MKSDKISEAVVRRLPVYLRFLNDLQKREISTVSSQELGQKLDSTPPRSARTWLILVILAERALVMMSLI